MLMKGYLGTALIALITPTAASNCEAQPAVVKPRMIRGTAMFACNFIHKALLAAVFLAAHFSPAISQEENFETVSSGETSLKVVGGEIRAHLNPNGCAAGFEAACSPVLQRSEYISTKSHKHGDRVIYSWEILVPKDFTYNASGAYLRAVRFLIGTEESIFNFLLDGKIGYDVGRKVCFGPEGFGKWHAIQVRVVWDSTKKKGLRDKTPGELRVLCDGIEVLSYSGRPNIGDKDEVRIALGLAGSLKLADGDSTTVSFRNIKIETW